MRMVLTIVVVAACIAAGPTAYADPVGTCPPACNRIPASAWIPAAAIPLDSTYSWPELAGLAVTARPARFRFEELCAIPLAADDPRSYVVAERSEVSNSRGQWQLRAQVLHWSGETWRGGALVEKVFAAAVAALRGCQYANPSASPSLTADQPDRLAAAVSGPVVLHEYLFADLVNSTLTELALWSDGPARTPWPAVTDTAVLDALGAPLCTAYLGSCP